MSELQADAADLTGVPELDDASVLAALEIEERKLLFAFARQLFQRQRMHGSQSGAVRRDLWQAWRDQVVDDFAKSVKGL